jgi:hypothetical protein
MGYQSRSDFFFNIREFAESLHATDIKALDEGLGLGGIQKTNRQQTTASRSTFSEPLMREISHANIAAVTVQNTPKMSQPNKNFKVKISQKRTHGKVYKFLNAMLARLGAHCIDLFMLSTVTVATILFFRRLAIIRNWQPVAVMDEYLDILKQLPFLQGISVCIGVIYILYILFWISFKIAGLKTPGQSLLVKEPISDSTT